MVRYLAKVTYKAKGRVDSYSTASGSLFSSLHKTGVIVTLRNSELKYVLVLEFSFRLLKPSENFTRAVKRKGWDFPGGTVVKNPPAGLPWWRSG